MGGDDEEMMSVDVRATSGEAQLLSKGWPARVLVHLESTYSHTIIHVQEL